MKVILTQNVKDVGQAGEVVNVSEGYFRNFLTPRKLAILATAGNLEVIKRKQQAEIQKAARAQEDAVELKSNLQGLSVTIIGKTGTGTRLYGSITSQDIADALKEQHKISLDKRDIHIEDPIKSTGSYTVPIKLHKDVAATLQVEIKSEGQEGAL